MPTGRFAPSPSGPLHLGNLRTALLAWLFARSAGSPFLMRIEDLDRERSRPEHETGQLADLRAIGIDWDAEPLRQSERTEVYRQALSHLEERNRVFPCWCTRAEIQAATQAPHSIEGAYPGTCRELSAEQRRRRERESARPPSLRLRSDQSIREFEDRLQGPQSGAIDDFVLWRWDDTPAYNLAVVVDDDAQRIEEVVRGDDLLASTPRQLLLYDLLGLTPPRYAHVPLVLGSDGRRLAKRHGAVTLSDRAVLGETPRMVRDWMAKSLGLAKPGESPELEDLVARFDPGRLPRQPTRFG